MPFIPDTNAIEALNRQLRKAIKTKGSFPNEDAARKLVYLALQNAVPQWTRTRNRFLAAGEQPWYCVLCLDGMTNSSTSPWISSVRLPAANQAIEFVDREQEPVTVRRASLASRYRYQQQPATAPRP